MGSIADTNKHLVLKMFEYALHSTEGLFVMAVALTSHWNFLTILAFLVTFFGELRNRSAVVPPTFQNKNKNAEEKKNSEIKAFEKDQKQQHL